MFGGRRTYVFLSIVVFGTLGCSGAGEVRYVYQDGHSGVIGMPANTSKWPKYYRKHADKMMEQHFPGGYEVVRAEEVVEGSRVLTINGSNSAEIQPTASTHLLAVGKLGRTTSRSQSDSLKIKECRILYRKNESLDPESQVEYAARAMWTPAPYIDPNALDRKLAKAKPDEPKLCEPGALAKAAVSVQSGSASEAKPAQADRAPVAGPSPPRDASVIKAF
ncbi:hypothetical protein SAMN05444166_0510 [Singulisphaera sp. GP187]|uniref:hypothetical protein n=1 Tax=Singulisphaera sp. GP187 TaxID=1882752 RepID=UPI00092C16FE|nr:hypothetical protein [Singulisphaera sp. GP187]SIN73263.1 hypothetical protein SAMN05444166_0510 [Singulisphaera sp. GP187]